MPPNSGMHAHTKVRLKKPQGNARVLDKIPRGKGSVFLNKNRISPFWECSNLHVIHMVPTIALLIYDVWTPFEGKAVASS